MGIITSIFEAIGSVVTGFLDVLSNLFNGVLELFYNTGESGGLTTLGIILIVGVATPLVFWGINWIVSFFRRMLSARKGK